MRIDFVLWFTWLEGLPAGGLPHSGEDDDRALVLGYESQSPVMGRSALVPAGTFSRR